MRRLTLPLTVVLVFSLMFIPAAFSQDEEPETVQVEEQEALENAEIEEGVVVPEDEEIEERFAFRATDFIGSDVQNPEGEYLGTIEDLVLDAEDGQTILAVISFGGFLGLGAELYAVPFELMTPRPIEGVFLLDIDVETLEEAPGFDADDWPLIGDREWGVGIFQFWDAQPPPAYHRPVPRAAPGWGVWGEAGWGGWGYDSEYDRLYNPATVDEFEAEVIRVEVFTPMAEMVPGVQLIIDYGDEPVPVHLGPVWYIQHQEDIEIEEGDQVTILGSISEQNGLSIIIAAEVEINDETLVLRGPDGVPVWTAVRRPGMPAYPEDQPAVVE